MKKLAGVREGGREWSWGKGVANRGNSMCDVMKAEDRVAGLGIVSGHICLEKGVLCNCGG